MSQNSGTHFFSPKPNTLDFHGLGHLSVCMYSPSPHLWNIALWLKANIRKHGLKNFIFFHFEQLILLYQIIFFILFQLSIPFIVHTKWSKGIFCWLNFKNLIITHVEGNGWYKNAYRFMTQLVNFLLKNIHREKMNIISFNIF